MTDDRQFWTLQESARRTVLLTVRTTPPTRVRTHSSSIDHPGRFIGLTPFEGAPVFVGDRLVFESPEHCLHAEEVVTEQSPELVVDRRFPIGTVRLHTESGKVLKVLCAGHEIGTTGQLLQLGAGPQKLVVLGTPAPSMKIHVPEGGQTDVFVPKPIRARADWAVASPVNAQHGSTIDP